FLIAYLLHPGTAVYVGYNSDLQNLEPRLCTRLATGSCDLTQPLLPRTRSRLINAGRELVVTVSCLLRFYWHPPPEASHPGNRVRPLLERRCLVSVCPRR